MKNFLLSLLLLLSISSHSQVVTESVIFDHYVNTVDNDFANYFNGSTPLYQVPTNGISGGSLVSPDTMNFGNDIAHYCSKYKGVHAATTRTSISFKYDSAQVVAGRFDRAVSIWMIPKTDFNHYVITSVTHSKRLEILTYAWANSPPLLSLHHNHWYELSISATFTGGGANDQVDLSAIVTDLGLSGTDPPIPVNSSTGTIHDNVFYPDTAIDNSISGAKWGGALYLDNFHYEGVKSADSCLLPTSIDEANDQQKEFIFTIVDKILRTDNSNNDFSSITIFDATGKNILHSELRDGINEFNLGQLSSGIYFLSVVSGDKHVLQKKLFIE